ncbi:MAG: hypothetical protein R2825_03335 [Saprospiraceae bacterium]
MYSFFSVVSNYWHNQSFKVDSASLLANEWGLGLWSGQLYLLPPDLMETRYGTLLFGK